MWVLQIHSAHVLPCVSDLHAVWEVPHPPYVWNISALQGLNLTPALSSLLPLPAEPAASPLLLLFPRRAPCRRKHKEADGAEGLPVCAGACHLIQARHNKVPRARKPQQARQDLRTVAALLRATRVGRLLKERAHTPGDVAVC